MTASDRVYDEPSAQTLIREVRQFLTLDLLPILEGRSRYLTRVAINALEISEREIHRVDEQAAIHEQRLAQLGSKSNRELAVAIKAGIHDHQRDLLIKIILEDVKEKLLVANPKYFESDT